MTLEWAALEKAHHLSSINRYSEALEELGPAQASDELAGEAHCIAARCHLGLKRPEQAIEAAGRAAAFDPEDEEPHVLLAIAWQQRNHPRRARQHALEAVRLAPDSAAALHVLAITQLNRFRRRRAQHAADVGVQENPHSPLAHYTLGKVSERRWRLGRAERAYRDGLALDPHSPDLSLGLATTLHRKGQTKDAARAYLAAARADPTDDRARRGLARLGLPLLGFGLFGKLAARDGAQGIVGHVHSLVLLTAIAAGTVTLLASITTYLHVRAARDLPAHLREALREDHREFVLGWIALAGFLALLLGLYADSTDAGSQRNPVLSYAVLAFAAVAFVIARRRVLSYVRGTARRFSRIVMPWR